MDTMIMMLSDMERAWTNSSECLWAVRSNISFEEYEKMKGNYMGERIYMTHGYDYLRKFMDYYPEIEYDLDECVPCKRVPHLDQCTMFCHKYNFEKGCMLNATK